MTTTLSYTECARALAACLRANRVAYLIGSPGAGKTSLVRAATAALGPRPGGGAWEGSAWPCVDLIASNCDATDIAGIPYTGNGELHRSMFPEIYRATHEPVVLFLDEITTISKSVEGPMLRLALERVAGGTPLHPDTRIVMAGNPAEQAPGGLQLSAALINRVVQLPYAPSLAEVRAFFGGAPVQPAAADLSADWRSAYTVEAAAFALLLSQKPDLLCFDPPVASVDQGEAWASPRAWQIGLEVWAADGAQDDAIAEALLAGAVGDHAALAMLTIRRMRLDLPTIEEVISSPATAKVPDRDKQIAALGLLAHVAAQDCAAAWVYCARLGAEYGAAGTQYLLTVALRPGSKHFAAGNKARVQLMTSIQRGATL